MAIGIESAQAALQLPSVFNTGKTGPHVVLCVSSFDDQAGESHGRRPSVSKSDHDQARERHGHAYFEEALHMWHDTVRYKLCAVRALLNPAICLLRSSKLIRLIGGIGRPRNVYLWLNV